LRPWADRQLVHDGHVAPTALLKVVVLPAALLRVLEILLLRVLLRAPLSVPVLVVHTSLTVRQYYYTFELVLHRVRY
jgi:hypothetical protein